MKTQKNILIGIMFICVFCYIFSIIKILNWKIDSNKTKSQIVDINEITDIKDIKDNKNTIIIKNDEIKEDDPYWDFIKVNLIDVDIQKLKNTNNDTKGWIQVNGTNINYPFVQTSDNDFYLNHTFDKSFNNAGWVFLDYRNNINNLDKNTILYAHGRLDNTMFGSLRNITKSDWYSNQNNYIVKLSTETENTLWQVFSVYHIPNTNDYIKTKFNSSEEFKSFIDMITERSFYNFHTSINENDYILTLSTCYDDYEKVVLHAKLIKKETKNT